MNLLLSRLLYPPILNWYTTNFTSVITIQPKAAFTYTAEENSLENITHSLIYIICIS